jgi:nucleotide-binding universal stress UspA family protein
MTVRCVLLVLSQAPSDAAALAAAMAVTKHLEAHLDAVLLVPNNDTARPMLVEPLPAGLREEVSSLLAEVAGKAASVALQSVEAACAAAGVPLVERPTGQSGASARWLATCTADQIARRACLADLVVLPRPSNQAGALAAALRETLLLSARRPLLLAPAAAVASVGRRVAVAWNGRPEAARAVGATLPFLARADAVRILTARTARTGAGEGERLNEYLRWHGIASEQAMIEPRPGESVGGALLREAAAFGADLLAMGGYGHSRWREMLLGGVTHHIAEHAELPILMGH